MAERGPILHGVCKSVSSAPRFYLSGPLHLLLFPLYLYYLHPHVYA